MRLEIRCHFNVVAWFFPCCIGGIDRWSAATGMHARTETHTGTRGRTHTNR